MPYIKQERRDVFEGFLPSASNPGELNYLFTQILLNYWIDFGSKYQTINDILGALEGAKLEFYRRVAAPYEEKKIKENGDVYD